MAMMPKAKHEELEENVFWATMSDLMLGLAVVFMTLFVLTMSGFSTQKVQQKIDQARVSSEVEQRLKQEGIFVQMDEMTGDIKISDLELFELNSWVLSPKGKAFLDKLIPAYIDTVLSKDELVETLDSILIQGHTDSQSFKGVSSKDEQFVKNMELSLKRANSVAEYIFQTKYNKKYSDKLRDLVVVEGKSFSEPVLNAEGKEDYAKSRRVELKLKIKRMDLSDAFGI